LKRTDRIHDDVPRRRAGGVLIIRVKKIDRSGAHLPDFVIVNLSRGKINTINGFKELMDCIKMNAKESINNGPKNQVHSYLSILSENKYPWMV
jgi:hypothetical protein